MKTVLVTGASSGIGAAIALRLIDDGWRVYVGARRIDRMEGLAARGAIPLSLDVTDDASMAAAIATIRSKSGHLDALINNAGYGAFGSLEETPPAEGRRQFDVNVFGVARLTQLALPMMRERREGAIVNITSMGGKIYEPFGSWYHASKFAVEGMSDCLRLELEALRHPGHHHRARAIRTEWAGIAKQGLLATSGNGPYAEGARNHARLLAGADTSRIVARPEAVAKVVAKALSARNPRPRYAAAGGAGPILFFRKILPDRLFDRFMGLTMRHAI